MCSEPQTFWSLLGWCEITVPKSSCPWLGDVCCLASKSHGRHASPRLCPWLSLWLLLAFAGRKLPTVAIFGKCLTSFCSEKLPQSLSAAWLGPHTTQSTPWELPGSKQQSSISTAVRGCCSAMSKTKLTQYVWLGWVIQLSYALLSLCDAVSTLGSSDYGSTKNIRNVYSEVGVRQGRVKPADGEELLSSPEALHDEPGQLLWPPDPPDRPAQIPQSRCWSCVRHLPGCSAAPPAHTPCWLSGTPAGPRHTQGSVIPGLWACSFEQAAFSIMPASFPACCPPQGDLPGRGKSWGNNLKSIHAQREGRWLHCRFHRCYNGIPNQICSRLISKEKTWKVGFFIIDIQSHNTLSIQREVNRSHLI